MPLITYDDGRHKQPDRDADGDDDSCTCAVASRDVCATALRTSNSLRCATGPASATGGGKGAWWRW